LSGLKIQANAKNYATPDLIDNLCIERRHVRRPRISEAGKHRRVQLSELSRNQSPGRAGEPWKANRPGELGQAGEAHPFACRGSSCPSPEAQGTDFHIPWRPGFELEVLDNLAHMGFWEMANKLQQAFLDE
jgi:hypothetical protein